MADGYTQKNSPMRFKAEELGDDDLLITRLTGTESLSRLFEFEREVRAPADKPVAFEDVLGEGGAVALDVPGGETRYFQGIVSRLAQGESTERFASYRAT